MGKFFGTDGIRGVANRELNAELALKVGMAVGYVFGEKSKIFVGKDPRISSDMLENALIAGLTAMGANAVSLGVVPTPAVAYLVRKEKADAGIMISASHNSFEFNGIKLFGPEGYKIPDETEAKIEELISSDIYALLPHAEKIGKAEINHDLRNEYIDYLKSTVKFEKKRNLKILIDCSNGSSSYTARKLFGSLGIEANYIFDEPNGININENCGSTNIENLSKIVAEKGYDLAFAFDGDADRCLAVDELGNIIDGDIILAICANAMKKSGNFSSGAIVGTIMSNMGLKKFCNENGIKFEETNVGDRCVLERMLEKNYILGGEQSGHIIFKEHSTTGDGQLTAIKLLEIMINSGEKFSSLAKVMKKYPQSSSAVKIELSQKGKILQRSEIKAVLEEIKAELGENGRIVVRESGTEPKIRIMAEHESEDVIKDVIIRVSAAVSEEITKMKGKN